MTRVLVDFLYYSGSRGGTETYAREIYSRLTEEAGVEWIGFASTELIEHGAPWFPGRLIDSGISGRNRARWALGELFVVDRVARRERADVVHAPANLGPVRSSVPVVLTLHDLLPFLHPEWVATRATGGLLRWMTAGAARNARAILTDSEASARDIETVLGIRGDRVTVTPLASSTPSTAPTQGPSDRVVFAPGNRMPHKNVQLLVRALAQIPTALRPRLEVTGGRPGDPLPSLARELGVSDEITIHGWLSHAELEQAYARAAVVALPTRFEGFGLPVLEAMVRGKPVVCSDLPVLREVGGDAAVYVDPDDAPGMAAALLALLDDDQQRVERGEAGRLRAAGFSWDRVAETTRAVLLAAARHEPEEPVD
jgi:Glycosyltransferase